MDVTIKINCDNAAFEGNASNEVKNVIKGLMDKFETMDLCIGDMGNLYDTNGNKTGIYMVTG